MSNSGTKIGQFTDEMEKAVSQTAKEVKDSVGEMIEQGVQSITGQQPTPQQIQQKQQEEQKQISETRRKLKFYQDLKNAQQKIRQEDLHEKQQVKQQEEQTEQERKLKEQEEKNRIIVSPAKKTPQFSGQQPVQEEIARSKQEIGKGHGIGG